MMSDNIMLISNKNLENREAHWCLLNEDKEIKSVLTHPSRKGEYERFTWHPLELTSEILNRSNESHMRYIYSYFY